MHQSPGPKPCQSPSSHRFRINLPPWPKITVNGATAQATTTSNIKLLLLHILSSLLPPAFSVTITVKTHQEKSHQPSQSIEQREEGEAGERRPTSSSTRKHMAARRQKTLAARCSRPGLHLAAIGEIYLLCRSISYMYYTVLT